MKRFLVLLIVGITSSLYAQNLKLYPPSKQYTDTSLGNFVSKLQRSIQLKDRNYLLSVIDKNIKLSFDGDDGIDNFKTMWKPGEANSPLWYYLDKLINLGGVYSNYKSDKISKDCFAFPYTEEIPSLPDTIDYSEIMVVTGSNINIRQKPDKSSKITGVLSFDVVKVDFELSFPQNKDVEIKGVTWIEEKEWYYITTLDKKISGYVFKDYVWSPDDYRLMINKINGKWKITCFIDGD